METTIAFRATTVGNDSGATPACLALTINDAIRQKILDATTAIRQFGFEQVVLRVGFYTPKVCDDALEDALDADEYVAIEEGLFDEADEQRVDCMTLVITDGDMWLRCFDHDADFTIESPLANIAAVLAITPVDAAV